MNPKKQPQPLKIRTVVVKKAINTDAKKPKRVLDISSGSVENLPVHTPRKAEKLSLSAKNEADLPRPEKDGLDEIKATSERYGRIGTLAEWESMWQKIRAWHEAENLKAIEHLDDCWLKIAQEKDARIKELEGFCDRQCGPCKGNFEAKIAALEKELKELKAENEKIKNPEEAKFFKCKNGHVHFMFDCEGCQYELYEALSEARFLARTEVLDEIEKFMEKIKLCENYEGCQEFISLTKKLAQMRSEEKEKKVSSK